MPQGTGKKSQESEESVQGFYIPMLCPGPHTGQASHPGVLSSLAAHHAALAHCDAGRAEQGERGSPLQFAEAQAPRWAPRLLFLSDLHAPHVRAVVSFALTTGGN